MSLKGNSQPIATRGSCVSCAPPHQTLPAFLNPHGIKTRYNLKLTKLTPKLSAETQKSLSDTVIS